MTSPAWLAVEGWLSSGSALSATGSYTVDADPDAPQGNVTLLRFGDDQAPARPMTTAARMDGADCWPSDTALAVKCSLELGEGASLVGEASTLSQGTTTPPPAAPRRLPGCSWRCVRHCRRAEQGDQV
ncbi:hypothetical protein [Tessaracoccus flavescens]|uniref:Uncharacterized protein n=1 Tax=Tessaracoccus flavescens TaxID=399497 RepID=A0A1Q2CYC8_9ACTN|nr:hypothetical protein [Tessaracoccus flavescens]AQP51093.1 hypothetical protein BW733_09910 [Tessaracoccus flavescens]